MGDKWDVHDEYGRKIGTAERQPSAIEQAVGAFILFWLVFQIVKGILLLIVLIVRFIFEHPKFTLSLTALGVLAALYYFGIYTPSKEREAQQAAAIRASAQAVQQAKVEKGLAFLQSYRGMLDISFTASDDRGRYVTVKSVEFTGDGIKVYVEAIVNSYTGPWNSCVTFTREDRNGASWIRPPTHEFEKLNDTPGKDHFVGYAYYPRHCTQDTCPDSSLPFANSQNKYLDFWIIPERISSFVDTTLYFKYECTWGSAAIRLFDFADFANGSPVENPPAAMSENPPTATPQTGALPEWLRDSDIITLKPLDATEGPRWLDGRTGDGTVGLVPQTDGGYSGTRWRVHVVDEGVITLECLGDLDGPRWLDGRTGDSTVGLAPQIDGYSGTRWRLHTTEYGIITLENLGDIDGPRWLDGRTGDSTVGLAPQADSYHSGTKWQVVQTLVQGVEPDRSTEAYKLAIEFGWQSVAENLLAQMITQVTFDTHGGEVDTTTSDDDQMTKRIVGEKERIEVKPNHCAIWWGWGGENTGSRFSAQQDWQLIQGPGNAQEGYGMMIRADGDTHYQFGIRDKEQQFDIEYWLQGNPEILQDWKFTDAIRPGQVNRIGVVADGGRFYFLINGIVAAELNDDRTNDGMMGSYFNTCDENHLTIFETDNFELRKP